MARASFAVVALLIATVHCAAARPEPAINAGHWAEASDVVSTDFSYASLAVRSEHSHGHHEKEDSPFTLLTKFIVRPSIAKEFIGAWLKFREVAQEAKGAKMVNLSKPLDNNVLFWGYEEWDSKADFFSFLKEGKSATKDLIKYIEEKDIPIIINQLVYAVPPHKPHKHASIKLRSKASAASMELVSSLLNDAVESVEDLMQPEEQQDSEVASFKEDTRKNKAIILTKFLVKPSEIVEFVEAFDKVTKAVTKHEKGNLVYGLSKPVNDDVSFYAYAVWEDKEAVKKHLESDYAKCFGKFVLANNVYLKTSLLLPIEKLDE